jgi:hypothetical protein
VPAAVVAHKRKQQKLQPDLQRQGTESMETLDYDGEASATAELLSVSAPIGIASAFGFCAGYCAKRVSHVVAVGVSGAFLGYQYFHSTLEMERATVFESRKGFVSDLSDSQLTEHSSHFSIGTAAAAPPAAVVDDSGCSTPERSRASSGSSSMLMSTPIPSDSTTTHKSYFAIDDERDGDADGIGARLRGSLAPIIAMNIAGFSGFGAGFALGMYQAGDAAAST